MKAQKHTLLIVDDDEAGRFLAQRTFEHLGTKYRVQLAANGHEALDYLKGKGKFADRKGLSSPLTSSRTCTCIRAMDSTFWNS